MIRSSGARRPARGFLALLIRSRESQGLAGCSEREKWGWRSSDYRKWQQNLLVIGIWILITQHSLYAHNVLKMENTSFLSDAQKQNPHFLILRRLHSLTMESNSYKDVKMWTVWMPPQLKLMHLYIITTINLTVWILLIN